MENPQSLSAIFAFYNFPPLEAWPQKLPVRKRGASTMELVCGMEDGLGWLVANQMKEGKYLVHVGLIGDSEDYTKSYENLPDLLDVWEVD